MKTILLILSFAGLQSFIYLVVPVTDYRDAYCGNYNGKRISQSYNVQTDALVNDTTNYTVVVSKNQADSILNITIREGVFSIKLINNKLQSFSSKYYGNFAGDTVFFYCKPGLGPQSFKYIGIK